MSKHNNPPDGKVTETTTRVVRKSLEEKKNPLPALIRNFLLEMDPEHEEELAQYQYQIKVQRIDRDRRVYVARVYDDLLGLAEQLAAKFGSGIFRLFITVLEDGNRVAFVKIEEFPVEYDGDLGPDQENPDKEEKLDRAFEMEKLERQHRHEREMKMMEVMARNNGGGGGGANYGMFLKIFQAGLATGTGQPVDNGEGGEEDVSIGGIIKALAQGVGAELAKRLQPAQISPPPPAAGDSASGGGE